MRHSSARLLIAALLSVFLCSCGFALRGSIDLPDDIEPFYLGSPNSSDLLPIELKNIFMANGLAMTELPADANYQLIITRQKSDRRSTSIGNDGRIAEYQLIETATFVIKDKKGRVATGPNEITERQILENNPNRVISTESEEKLIRDEMKKNLARKIARQVSQFDYRAYESLQQEKKAQKKNNAS